MFDKLMKRSNAVWVYSTGRFAEERRRFLCDLMDRGHDGWHALRQTNRLLLAVAEQLNVRQRMAFTEQQIVRAARDCISKTCSASCTDATRDTAMKRFIFVAKQWLHFLGKWSEPDRNSQLKQELDSFLKEIRDQKGYSPETIPLANRR
jgi:integrase/recombinase XerD